ncbi:MAG: hypothetical protein WBA17_14320 [Saprospiraceae bacterium]
MTYASLFRTALLSLLLSLVAAAEAQINVPFGTGQGNVVANASYAREGSALLNEAERLVRSGQLEQAILRYDAALAKVPNWLPALVERALLLNRIGRTLEARRDLNHAERVDPIATNFLMGRNSEAIIKYLALFPGASLDQVESPHDYFVYPDYEQPNYLAQELAQLQLLPDSSLVARIVREQIAGNWLRAELYIDEYPERNLDERATKAFLHGTLEMILHDYQSALADYDRVVQYGGGNWPELQYNRALAYILSNNFNQGCTLLSEAVNADYPPAERIYVPVCGY